MPVDVDRSLLIANVLSYGRIFAVCGVALGLFACGDAEQREAEQFAEYWLQKFATLPKDTETLPVALLQDWKKALDQAFDAKSPALLEYFRKIRDQQSQDDSAGWISHHGLFGYSYNPAPWIQVECGVQLNTHSSVRMTSFNPAFNEVLENKFLSAPHSELSTDSDSWQPTDDTSRIYFELIAPEEGYQLRLLALPNLLSADVDTDLIFNSFGRVPPDLPFHPLSPAANKLWRQLCGHLVKRLNGLNTAM